MKEKLIIKNFGPIKEIELDLGKFNVLIGEQATGKSTVAKVLAVCRYFSYLLDGDKINNPFEEGIIAWGLEEFIKNDTYLFYDCYHYSFTVNRDKTLDSDFDEAGNLLYERDFYYFKTKLEAKSIEFRTLLSELQNIKPESKSLYDFSIIGWKPPTSFFQNDVARVMDNPFYLPTERGLQSLFSLGKTSVQNISDSLFNQFAKLDQIARSFKEETLIEPVNIKYKNVNGRGYIKSRRHDFLSLFNAATGYQNIIPIVLLVKYYTDQGFKKKKKTFIIEEPGENLFPSAQFELVKFFAENLKYHNAIFLTTHTPYILTSLNNLMYAYQVGQNHKGDVVKIIEERYWVNPDNISAYRLMTDGTAKNILDDEIKQIDAGELDEISRSINEEWDKISDIKFSAINEH